MLPPSLWGRRGFARNALVAAGVSRVPPLPRPLLDARLTARGGAWWTGSGALRRPGERAKWPLGGDLAVDGHVASPCLMAIYCKIPLQLPHFTTAHPGLLRAPLPVHHAPPRAVNLAPKSGLGRGGTRETPAATIALRAKPLLPQREGGNTTSSVGQPFKAF